MRRKKEQVDVVLSGEADCLQVHTTPVPSVRTSTGRSAVGRKRGIKTLFIYSRNPSCVLNALGTRMAYPSNCSDLPHFVHMYEYALSYALIL